MLLILIPANRKRAGYFGHTSVCDIAVNFCHSPLFCICSRRVMQLLPTQVRFLSKMNNLKKKWEFGGAVVAIMTIKPHIGFQC